jgi:hypothetical protein
MKTLVILLVVEGLSLVASIPQFSIDDIRDWLDNPSKDETTAFVNDQYANWMGAHDCQAFVDSFTEPFEYCDATKDCLTTKDELMDECKDVAKLAGQVYSLEVKPSWTPVWDFSSIAITGRQSLAFGAKQVGCFDFAVVEELNRTASGNLTSHLWRGYYTIAVGGCGKQGFNPVRSLVNWIRRTMTK